ncbi:MAG: mechanosensitive ion channel [Francisellaceae bacterium]|nr:mechanosensitive ion channel [Francisellaceae bacterium]MBT6208291.1 mechanosensitive ion channel [Francisellaceae bacterium]MBT6538083.1 mechanosensitive ion channel [Francisellaceae bacterium]
MKVVLEDDFKSEIFKFLLEVWNIKLFDVSDHHISVGNLVAGLVFVSLAFWLARKLRNKITVYLIKNNTFERQQIATFGNIFYYVAIIILVLLALNIANIPLTTFTIIGGAVVIGVGFGSQSIVNNFMSGLILLAEQPIRIGDVIEIDDLKGVVEHLGARSTRIRTMYNTCVIVPNSMVLSQRVVNFTLVERAVLIDVVVGFNYGSDTDTVTEILKKAVAATDEIVHKLETIVTFNDFGSSSLIFSVKFYIKIKNHLQQEIIQSNVRYKIEKLSKDAGLVIAFSQLDVHLDVKGPIKFSEE